MTTELTDCETDTEHYKRALGMLAEIREAVRLPMHASHAEVLEAIQELRAVATAAREYRDLELIDDHTAVTDPECALYDVHVALLNLDGAQGE